MPQTESFQSHRPVDALKTEVNWWVESEDGKALKQTATLMAPRYVHRAYVHVCMCVWVQVSPPREGGKFLWERSKWSKKANWHQGHMRNVNSPVSHRVLLLCLLKDDRQEQFPTNWLYLDPLKNHLGWEKESICTVPPRDGSDERLSGTLCHGLSDKGVSLTLVTLPLIMNPPKLRTFWNKKNNPVSLITFYFAEIIIIFIMWFWKKKKSFHVSGYPRQVHNFLTFFLKKERKKEKEAWLNNWKCASSSNISCFFLFHGEPQESFKMKIMQHEEASPGKDREAPSLSVH